jgi:hypothetical protein
LIAAAILLEFAAQTAGAGPAKLDVAALDPCPKSDSGEIVVCGSRRGRSPYRLPELPKEYDRKPLRAEGNMAGTHARAHLESNVRPDGLVDKRIMVTFSTPF